jgi:predicted N-acyltransferase
LKSKRRTQIRRERREPERQGITIRTVRGDELVARAAHWADTAHELYRTTCEKYMWGGAYLNRGFFDHIFAHLPQQVELVLAERRGGGKPVAGAINLSTATHLYGRYWGCHEELQFLHFNVCLYHSIEDCIARDLKVFEGGAGGEHKVARGFEPEIVHCAHWFSDERAHRLLSDALERDFVVQQARTEAWHEQNGGRQPP